MKTKIIIGLLTVAALGACDNSSEEPSINIPETYSFEREGQSTVSFSGQTARIGMAQELIGSMTNFNSSETSLLEMYRNETADGGDANPYEDQSLNESIKSVRNKVAASNDFFSANTVESLLVKNEFETWISNQVTEVFPNEEVVATPGVAGQLADGTSTRYVNGQGLEYNQLVNKGLIGALMLDQILNNYLSTEVLDAGDNVENNNNDILEDGKPYTTMEHKWDEAYGYLYGASVNAANPNETLGTDDSFLNKYLASVDEDPDFTGIADDIFNAFKTGRAAITNKSYDLRDEQIAILREKLSLVLAVRAVHYLQAGKSSIEAQDMGAAFHDLSEAYGFIYSLRFTRVPNTNSSFYTREEVDTMLEALLSDGENGLWNVSPATLQLLSEDIAGAFGFTTEQSL